MSRERYTELGKKKKKSSKELLRPKHSTEEDTEKRSLYEQIERLKQAAKRIRRERNELREREREREQDRHRLHRSKKHSDEKDERRQATRHKRRKEKPVLRAPLPTEEMTTATERPGGGGEEEEEETKEVGIRLSNDGLFECQCKDKLIRGRWKIKGGRVRLVLRHPETGQYHDAWKVLDREIVKNGGKPDQIRLEVQEIGTQMLMFAPKPSSSSALASQHRQRNPEETDQTGIFRAPARDSEEEEDEEEDENIQSRRKSASRKHSSAVRRLPSRRSTRRAEEEEDEDDDEEDRYRLAHKRRSRSRHP